MTKKVTRADGVVSFVSEEFLDSVVQEGDTVEDFVKPTVRPEPTAEEIANQLIEIQNNDARRYLAETDWYVARKAETGKAIPDEVFPNMKRPLESILQLSDPAVWTVIVSSVLASILLSPSASKIRSVPFTSNPVVVPEKATFPANVPPLAALTVSLT